MIAAFICCCFLVLSSEALAENDRITKLEKEMQTLAEEMRGWKKEVEELLNTDFRKNTFDSELKSERLNETIEERVAILEFQVAEHEVDITDMGEDLDLVEGEVAVISAEQVLQDERILELEMDSDSAVESISALESADEELNASIITLDDRVTVLNATLGTVEGTVSDHEASLTELDGRVQELEAGLMVVEDVIAEIQGRIDKLEVSGTVAFHVDLDQYTSIPEDSVVIFGQVFLNLGDGYNSATGEFTVPSGGAGLYFFYVSFVSDVQEFTDFLVRVNGGGICRTYTDINTSGAGDRENPSCGAVAALAEGDTVHVFYNDGTDDSPVRNNTSIENTFTGFRIAPE